MRFEGITLATYTVTWLHENGTVLETDTDVVAGTMPIYDGAEPFKAEDAQYTCAFSGWDKPLVPDTGDVTYTAVFTATEKEPPLIPMPPDLLPPFVGETEVTPGIANPFEDAFSRVWFYEDVQYVCQ